MKYLSKVDLEAIAARVLRAYWRIPEAEKEPCRVNPDLLLTTLLGLHIEHRHLSPDGLTLGLTCFDEDIGIEVFGEPSEEFYVLDGKTVLIEADLNNLTAVPGRRNFTVAHEGCHHILHMLFPHDYCNGVSSRKILHYRLSTSRRSSFDWEEWQADTLASAILMPSDLLLNNMASCGIPKGISMLNRLWRREDYDKFSQVSSMMGVSKQALSIRMKQLGLIGKDYLSNPYALLDIFKEDNEE